MRLRLPQALLLGATLVALALAGCDGPNPILEDGKPDPTPMPVVTPTPNPADVIDPQFYPGNKAPYQWAAPAKVAKKALLQAIWNCTWRITIEAQALTDPEIEAALVKASRNTSRVTNRAGVGIVVYLDGLGERRAQNQATFDELKAKGFTVTWAQDPRTIEGDDGDQIVTPRFRALGLNTVYVLDAYNFAGEELTYEGEMFTFDAPLTPAGFGRERGSATITTVSADMMEAYTAMSFAYYGSEFEQSVASLVVGPMSTRRRLPEILGNAKTSLDLRVETLSDPGIVKVLAERVRAGVTIRVVLPAGRPADKAALAAAGISEVRLADEVAGCLVVVDGKATLQGAAGFDADAIDLDRTQYSFIENAEIAGRAKAELAASWPEI